MSDKSREKKSASHDDAAEQGDEELLRHPVMAFPPFTAVMVTAQRLPLHTEPDAESKVLGEVRLKEVVPVLEAQGPWLMTVCKFQEAWFEAEYVERVEQDAPAVVMKDQEVVSQAFEEHQDSAEAGRRVPTETSAYMDQAPGYGMQVRPGTPEEMFAQAYAELAFAFEPNIDLNGSYRNIMQVFSPDSAVEIEDYIAIPAQVETGGKGGEGPEAERQRGPARDVEQHVASGQAGRDWVEDMRRGHRGRDPLRPTSPAMAMALYGMDEELAAMRRHLGTLREVAPQVASMAQASWGEDVGAAQVVEDASLEAQGKRGAVADAETIRVAPGQAGDVELMLEEAAHVVQHANAQTGRSSDEVLREAAGLEAEADSAVAAALAGEHFAVRGAAQVELNSDDEPVSRDTSPVNEADAKLDAEAARLEEELAALDEEWRALSEKECSLNDELTAAAAAGGPETESQRKRIESELEQLEDELARLEAAQAALVEELSRLAGHREEGTVPARLSRDDTARVSEGDTSASDGEPGSPELLGEATRTEVEIPGRVARFFDAPVYEVDTLAPGFPGLDPSQANFAVTAELLDELVTTLGAMSDLELELLWLIVRQRAQSPAALAPEVEQVRSLFDRLSRIEALDLSEAHETALELATVARLYLEQSGVKGEQADAIAAALAELEAGLNSLLIVPGERSPDDTVVQVACAGIVVVAGGILANDVTGVGVVDDLLLIPLGIALGGLLLYDAARGRQASAEKTNEALVGVSAGAAKLTQEILESLSRPPRPPAPHDPPRRWPVLEAIVGMLAHEAATGDSTQEAGESIKGEEGSARTAEELAKDGWVAEPPESVERQKQTGTRSPTQASATSEDLREEVQVAARGAARSLLDRARGEQDAVLAVLREVGELNGVELVGLEAKLKSEDSLTRKIADRVRSGQIRKHGVERAVELQAAKINDALRFTYVLQFENYSQTAESLLGELETRGLVFARMYNGWSQAGTASDTGYRGLNATLRTPSGLEFELQLHTSESLAHAKATHPLYEEQRAEGTTAERSKELIEQQRDMASKVAVPEGAGGVR